MITNLKCCFEFKSKVTCHINNMILYGQYIVCYLYYKVCSSYQFYKIVANLNCSNLFITYETLFEYNRQKCRREDYGAVFK